MPNGHPLGGICQAYARHSVQWTAPFHSQGGICQAYAWHGMLQQPRRCIRRWHMPGICLAWHIAASSRRGAVSFAGGTCQAYAKRGILQQPIDGVPFHSQVAYPRHMPGKCQAWHTAAANMMCTGCQWQHLLLVICPQLTGICTPVCANRGPPCRSTR